VSRSNETMRYQTFDLTISATGAPREYLLAVQSTQGEPSARTKIEFDAAPLANWLQQLAEHTLAPQDLQALGVALYECLFVGEIHLVFQRALGETLGRDDLGLRLRLRINPPELAALPWEYLYSPERRLFLAASVETPVSRYLNLNKPLRSLTGPEQIRLLVVIPQNTDLDTVTERETLEKIALKITDRSLEILNFSHQQKIKRPVSHTNEFRGKIAIDFLEGLATTAAIRAARREKEYHIFHYAGHGAFKNDAAFLYLDHEEKFTEEISAEHFAHFFTEDAFTRLVFLNACQGATRSSHQALAGLAQQLVFHDVPAVIAMQDRIANDDAILFATEFYEELCHPRDGGQIEVAISRARKALLQERPASAVFGNPVLYLRAENGRLWEAQKTELPPPPPVKEKKILLEHWLTWVGLIGGILGILIAALDLHVKISELLVSNNKSDSSQTAIKFELQTLAGQILDESNEPLSEVIVMLPEYSKTDTTNQLGRYEFEVKAPHQAQVRIQATKPGYHLLTKDQTLGIFNEYTIVKKR